MGSCQCCKNNVYLKELTDNYLSQSIPIQIEKECGFLFLIYLNENSTLIDLYRYVEQYYNHINDTKMLFSDNERLNLIIRDETSLKNFIVDNKLTCYDKTNFKFYLSFY